MPTLKCEISEPLMQALAARSARSGESVDRIVSEALAAALDLDGEEAPLFQVSTATALVEGVSGGVVTIGELKENGDFGLGTFSGLDGEMIAFAGEFYQVRGDGVVREPGDEALVPFAVVTYFEAEREFSIDRVASFDDLAAQLDAHRQTDNLFFAVRLDGRFARMRTRSVSKTPEGTPWWKQRRSRRYSTSPTCPAP